MPLLPSLNYYRRIASAYLLGGQKGLASIIVASPK